MRHPQRRADRDPTAAALLQLARWLSINSIHRVDDHLLSARCVFEASFERLFQVFNELRGSHPHHSKPLHHDVRACGRDRD